MSSGTHETRVTLCELVLFIFTELSQQIRLGIIGSLLLIVVGIVHFVQQKHFLSPCQVSGEEIPQS